MSAAEKIAKLEGLLERIQNNREDAPVSYPGATDAAGEEPEAVAASPVESPTPTPTPAVPSSAVVGSPTPTRAKSPKPTPMEQAISTELELGPPDDDEPELEISYPDEDEPELILESAESDALTEPPPPEATPTAPVDTRAPAAEPTAARIDVAAAQPSTPIAKVVSRPQPKTFGELLDRALALRPR